MINKQLSLDLDIQRHTSLSDFSGPGWSTLMDAVRQLHVGLIRQMYVYGSPDTGKTHLLTAICESFLDIEKRAMYLSLAELVEAETDVDVLSALEMFDVIAIDDLEVIQGRPEWQEAIFHFINRSREGQGQLIFASQLPARDLPFELRDLVTRLNQAPAFKVPEGHDIADRQALLESVLRRRSWQFDERITAHLLQEGPHRIGGMLGILNVIQPLFANLPRANVSKAMINQAIQMIDEQTLAAELDDISKETQADYLSKSQDDADFDRNMTLDF